MLCNAGYEQSIFLFDSNATVHCELFNKSITNWRRFGLEEVLLDVLPVGGKRNYLTEEINQNEFMSKNLKKVYRVLNYIEHILILISTVTGCISISAFASLVDIPIRNTSSGIGLKICAITAGIKKFKSIIRDKKTNF